MGRCHFPRFSEQSLTSSKRIRWKPLDPDVAEVLPSSRFDVVRSPYLGSLCRSLQFPVEPCDGPTEQLSWVAYRILVQFRWLNGVKSQASLPLRHALVFSLPRAVCGSIVPAGKKKSQDTTTSTPVTWMALFIDLYGDCLIHLLCCETSAPHVSVSHSVHVIQWSECLERA